MRIGGPGRILAYRKAAWSLGEPDCAFVSCRTRSGARHWCSTYVQGIASPKRLQHNANWHMGSCGKGPGTHRLVCHTGHGRQPITEPNWTAASCLGYCLHIGKMHRDERPSLQTAGAVTCQLVQTARLIRCGRPDGSRTQDCDSNTQVNRSWTPSRQ